MTEQTSGPSNDKGCSAQGVLDKPSDKDEAGTQPTVSLSPTSNSAAQAAANMLQEITSTAQAASAQGTSLQGNLVQANLVQANLVQANPVYSDSVHASPAPAQNPEAQESVNLARVISVGGPTTVVSAPNIVAAFPIKRKKRKVIDNRSGRTAILRQSASSLVQALPDPNSALVADKIAQPASSPASLDKDSKAPEKKKPLSWDRSMDVLKVAATVLVAIAGTIATKDFNDRQHELNRIEAIAQMLPHMADDAKAQAGDHMGRDGAIWAIFRTANNRKMLRDLAALFPADIYRVVSSIASGGELDHDPDALVALQVSSEKLAAKYSIDPSHAEAASKLYSQALMLKKRDVDDPAPLHLLDLTAIIAGSKPTDDQLAALIKSINALADQHLKDVPQGKAKKDGSVDPNGTHWESKQLYLRAVRLGESNKDKTVTQQVLHADLALAGLYVTDQLADDAFKYFKAGLDCEAIVTGQSSAKNLKALDKDGDGYAALPELADAIKQAQERQTQLLQTYKDKGADLTAKDSPKKD